MRMHMVSCGHGLGLSGSARRGATLGDVTSCLPGRARAKTRCAWLTPSGQGAPAAGTFTLPCIEVTWSYLACSGLLWSALASGAPLHPRLRLACQARQRSATRACTLGRSRALCASISSSSSSSSSCIALGAGRGGSSSSSSSRCTACFGRRCWLVHHLCRPQRALHQHRAPCAATGPWVTRALRTRPLLLLLRRRARGSSGVP